MSDAQAATPRPTVFVVDDDPSVRSGLERLLRCLGWAVWTFASAEEFLARHRHTDTGCLIVDVHLGRISGIELQAQLAGRRPHMPVIVTSGSDDGDPEVEALRLGATAFLRKPFEVEALLTAIAGACPRAG